MTDRDYTRSIIRATLQEYLQSTRTTRADRFVAWCLGIALRKGGSK